MPISDFQSNLVFNPGVQCSEPQGGSAFNSDFNLTTLLVCSNLSNWVAIYYYIFFYDFKFAGKLEGFEIFSLCFNKLY